MSIGKVKKSHSTRKKSTNSTPLRLSITKITGFGICQLQQPSAQNNPGLKALPDKPRI